MWMKVCYWFGWGVIFVIVFGLFIVVFNWGSVILGVGSIFIGVLIVMVYECYFERIGEVIVDERIECISEKSYVLSMCVFGFIIVFIFVLMSIIF